MDELDLMARPVPTPARPLLGQTLLLVEDSRYASEAMRLLALRSGARIRRADCIASARRHLNTYRPGIAVVDLHLPDGNGLELIARLAGSSQRPAAVIACSGLSREEVEGPALRAGADAFLSKPVESLAVFQNTILRQLPEGTAPKGLRLVTAEVVEPDRLALQEDLGRAARLLADPAVTPGFVADFLRGVARTGHDAGLLSAVEGAARSGEAARAKLASAVRARLDSAAAV